MDNLTPRQRKILKNLKSSHPAARVGWDEFRGTARVLRGAHLGPVQGADVVTILDGVMPLFGPPLPATSWLRPRRDRLDDFGRRHLEYQQVMQSTRGAIEVYRSVLAIHVRSDGGSVSSIQSNCFRDVAVTPFDDLHLSELQHRLLTDLDA